MNKKFDDLKIERLDDGFKKEYFYINRRLYDPQGIGDYDEFEYYKDIPAGNDIFVELFKVLNNELPKAKNHRLLDLLEVLKPPLNLSIYPLLIGRIISCYECALKYPFNANELAGFRSDLMLWKTFLNYIFQFVNLKTIDFKLDKNPFELCRALSFTKSAMFCENNKLNGAESETNLIELLSFFLLQVSLQDYGGEPIDKNKGGWINKGFDELRKLKKSSANKKRDQERLKKWKHLKEVADQNDEHLQQQFKIVINICITSIIEPFRGSLPALKMAEKFFDKVFPQENKTEIKIIDKPDYEHHEINVEELEFEHGDFSFEQVSIVTVEPKGNAKYVTSEELENAGIYGSNLSLSERLHLPWRTNVLTSYELTDLIMFLNKELTHSTSDELLGAIYSCILLLTSKPIKYIEKLVIRKGESELCFDYIDAENGLWNRDDLNWEGKYKTDIKLWILNSHRRFLKLPLPTVLLSAIERIFLDTKTSSFTYLTLDTKIKIEKNLTRTLKKYKSEMALSRNITYAMVRATFFQQLTIKLDSEYASLILSNSEYIKNAQFYYLSDKQTKLQNAYVELLNENKLISQCIVQPNNLYSGSIWNINTEIFSQYLKTKVSNLNNQFKEDKPSLTSLLERHNFFTSYVVLLLSTATSHRPRVEYGFEEYVIQDEYILISDKKHYIDSEVRINILPTIAQQQLTYYRNHCYLLAKKLPEKLNRIRSHLKSISECKKLSLPLFGNLDVNGNWRAIGRTDLMHNFLSELNLPDNALRHQVCSMLRDKGIGKAGKQFMGHVGLGEHHLSAHSFSCISDVKSLKNGLEEILNELGFENIAIDKGPGKKVNLPTEKIHRMYKPCWFTSKTVSKSDLIKWARKHVEPIARIIIKLSDEDAAEFRKNFIDKTIFQADTDFPKRATSAKAIIFVNRFLNKLMSNNKHWRVLNYENQNLYVTNATINKDKQAQIIKKYIHSYIIESKFDETKEDLFCKVLLSLIVNSGLSNCINNNLINHLKKTITMEEGTPWIEWVDNKKTLRYFVDAVSFLLLVKFKEQVVKGVPSVEKLNIIYEKIYKRIIGLPLIDSSYASEFKCLNSLSSFLSSNFELGISSTVQAYRSGNLDTNILPIGSLIRWKTGNKFFVARKKNEINFDTVNVQLPIYNQSKISYSKSHSLISDVQGRLGKEYKEGNSISTKVFTQSTIANCWSKAIGLDLQGIPDLKELIKNSPFIDPTTVSTLVFIYEASTRKGTGKGRLISLNSLSTYMSHIGKPLLNQNLGVNFFEMDKFELTDLYIKVLNTKVIKKRAYRAGRLRDFHNTIQKYFFLPSIDWFEVEPRIKLNDSDVSANIITIREYNNAIKLLQEDKVLVERSRRLNLICLILCYRIGLRSEEAQFLQIRDIDTKNWVIHIRTKGVKRTKTPSGNRRIPAYLFLSEKEKKIIQDQISHLFILFPDETNTFIFSLKNNNRKVVPFHIIVNRVIEALRIVSGDQTLTLHHCRHSFVSHLTLVMSYREEKCFLYDQLKEWGMGKSLTELSKTLRYELTGDSSITNKCGPSISLLLGHSEPFTTIIHYTHIHDILLFEFNERSLMKNYSIKFISELARISPNNARKIKEHNINKFNTYQLMANKVLSSSNLRLFRNVRKEKENSIDELKPIFIKSNDEHYENLIFINKVIELYHKKVSPYEIGNIFALLPEYIELIISLMKDIKSSTGFSGLYVFDDETLMQDIEYSERSKKYISNSDFKNILSKLSELIANSIETFNSVIGDWEKNYHFSYSVIIQGDENILFSELTSFTDLSFELDPKPIFIKERHRKITYRKVIPYYTSNGRTINYNKRFNYIMFICKVYNSLLNMDLFDL